MAIHKRYISPRQKMINLMYIVLMAMLALNVEPAGSHEGFPLMREIKTPDGQQVTPERILDKHDIRTNDMKAMVIPSAHTILQGGTLEAEVMMAAIDTLHRPEIFIDGEKVITENNTIRIPCRTPGSYMLEGELRTTFANGDTLRTPFAQPYTVIEPSSTVSPDLLNMLYAGYENPISISVPGITLKEVNATMTGGTLHRTKDGKFLAKPEKAGTEAVITVTCNKNGQSWTAGRYAFRVRPLPEPAPFLTLAENGQQRMFRGGAVNKAMLLAAGHIEAAVDDGILSVPFRVQSFEMIFFDNMGNAIPVASQDDRISERQKEIIRSLAPNRRFYISRVKATGPDGSSRKLNSTIEVVVR